MPLFVIIIHVIVCIALIMIVLLQTGKGADMGAAFGGGSSNTLFGTTGASTFLGKMTTVAAVVFMLTSLILAYSATQRRSTSVLVDEPAATQTTTESATEAAPPAAETKSQPATEAAPPAAENPPAANQQEEQPKGNQ